jgi:hypothetical protein
MGDFLYFRNIYAAIGRACVQKLLLIILIIMIATVLGILWVKPIADNQGQNTIQKSMTP